MRNDADGLRCRNPKAHVPSRWHEGDILHRTWFDLKVYVHTTHLGTQYLPKYLVPILRRRNSPLHKQRHMAISE